MKSQLRKGGRELQKSQRELQVASDAVSEAQRLALSKSEEVRSCRQQLKGVEKLLDLACEKVISVETTSIEAVVRSKIELARLQKECTSSRQHTATTESAVTVLHKEVELVRKKVSELELENATPLEECETSSKTHARTEVGLAEDLGATCGDLGKEKRECDTLRAKVGELEKRFAAVHNALKANKKKLEGLESQVALDAKAIAHLES